MLAVLAGCSGSAGPDGINDPYEAMNRRVHQTNIGLDRNVVGPTAKAYGNVVPEPVQKGLENFSDNFGTPGLMVNNLLQGDVEHLVEHTFRFVINTTFGIGGLLDPAQAIGLAGKDTDFGETLHVWGIKEGAYLELPFLGPSTERDAAGLIVDTALNPLGYVLPAPEKYAGTVAKIATRVGDRNRYGDLVDSILYDSADSYAQSRLLYLQNRRFELGDTSQDENFDPYEDPYAQ